MSPSHPVAAPSADDGYLDPRMRELSPGDLRILTNKGWLPAAFPALDAMRELHESLIDQRQERYAALHALHEKFAAEDRAKTEEIEAALREQRPEKLPDLTPADERERLIAEANERADAAAKVALQYALDVRDQLRGPVPAGWEAALAVQALKVPPHGLAAEIMAELNEDAARLKQQADELARQLEAVRHQIDAAHSSRVWLSRTANGTRGHVVDASLIGVVAPKHTPGSKPREDLAPWQQSDDPATRVEHIGDPARDTTPQPRDDGEESHIVDTSDPWFEQAEARSPAREEF